METFIQQIISGLASGSIYASVALALVMIYQATDVVNFAQGNMAMFSTYLAWTLLQAGFSYWVAFFLTVGLSFIGGLVIERLIIRPVESAPILTIVIVSMGLLVILNSIAGWVYSYLIKPFPSPFPKQPMKIGNIVLAFHDLGAIGVTLMMLLLLYLFFRFTPLGLTLRAAAQNPGSSRLVGIRVSQMLMLGWGLAAIPRGRGRDDGGPGSLSRPQYDGRHPDLCLCLGHSGWVYQSRRGRSRWIHRRCHRKFSGNLCFFYRPGTQVNRGPGPDHWCASCKTKRPLGKSHGQEGIKEWNRKQKTFNRNTESP